MKKYLLIPAFLFLQPLTLLAQSTGTISGNLIDQNRVGFSGLQLQLYIDTKVYSTTSRTDGSFTFSDIADVREAELPSGYSVSENYPNPFNPRTRIALSLPGNCKVRVDVFNLLGQKVMEDIERYFYAGESFIDLEFNGLPNGFYLARITLDEKYSVVKKLILLYGSRHLSSSIGDVNNKLYKSIAYTKIDSLVVTGVSVFKKVFANLPSITGSTLNLGDLEAERICPGGATVAYAGRIYNTVLIGSQCWLKENLNIGTMLQGNQNPASNGAIEKYCFNNDSNNCAIYGGLYQWTEAMQYGSTAGRKGICPAGWHIPTRTELEILSAAANSDGNALKSVGQGTGNGAGTNKSGFSALLSGYRGNDSYFYFLGSYTRLWSSSENTIYFVNFMNLYSSQSSIGFGTDGDKEFGYSVRCLKD